MTVGKTDPELRGGAGSGAAGQRGGQRHRPGQRRPLRRRTTPACRPNWKRCRNACSTTTKKRSRSPPGCVSTIIDLKKLAQRRREARPKGCDKLAARRQQARRRRRPPRHAQRGSLGNGLARLGGGADGPGRRHRPPRRRRRSAGSRAWPKRRRRKRAAGKRAGRSERAGARRQGADQPPGAPVAAPTPGLFNSGYFVLSALDGTPPKTREAVGERSTSPRRPGGVDAGHLRLHLQHPRLDRAQQAARTATPRELGEEAGPDDRRRRRRRPAQRLQPRHPRPDPLDHRRRSRSPPSWS